MFFNENSLLPFSGYLDPVTAGVAIVGGSVVSGILGNEAAGSASRASERSSEASTAEQRRQFDLQREDTAPYREAGVNALGTLEQRLAGPQGGMPPPVYQYGGEQPQFAGGDRFNFDLEGDQGYQFARDEGIKATNREMAAGGKYGSGNRLAEIADRVTGIASQYANDAYNRQMGTSRENYGRGVQEYGFDVNREGNQYARGMTQYGLEAQREQDIYGRDQNYLNRLSSVAGIGQSAVGQSGAAGSNMANAIGNINMANASAQGNAAAMQYGSLNNSVQGGISNYLTYQGLQNPPGVNNYGAGAGAPADYYGGGRVGPRGSF